MEDVDCVEGRKSSWDEMVASGEWRVASGEWRVASGEWRVAGGLFTTNNEQLPTGNGSFAVISRDCIRGFCHY